jgi:hypothetical protein
MLEVFLIKDSFGVMNRNQGWIQSMGASSEFHAEVMDALKEHTLLSVCEIRECSMHRLRNSVRDRRMLKEKRRLKKLEGKGIRHC